MLIVLPSPPPTLYKKLSVILMFASYFLFHLTGRWCSCTFDIIWSDWVSFRDCEGGMNKPISICVLKAPSGEPLIKEFTVIIECVLSKFQWLLEVHRWASVLIHFPVCTFTQVRYLLQGGAKCRTLFNHPLGASMYVEHPYLVDQIFWRLSESSMFVAGAAVGDDSVCHMVQTEEEASSCSCLY